MYTVEIGRQFLRCYNEKTGNDYSALEFFEEEFFPVMFDSEDYLHLMHVHNSPFFQRLYKKDHEKYPDSRDSIIRKNKFYDSIGDVTTGKQDLGGNLGVGFMAKGIDGTTSGQVSNIQGNFTEQEILYSWFGGALGVGFEGGYDFLFEDKEINWFLYKGWKYYREYLNQTADAKGRQIETWNGLWINYGLKYSDDLDKAFQKLMNRVGDHTKKAGSKIKLDRPAWVKQVFSLARYFDGQKDRVLMYGYGFGQMNKTLGFLQLELIKVKYMADLFDHLIADDPELSRTEKVQIEKAYETFFSIEQVCALGGIGVQALRPKDLKKYTAWTDNKNVKTLNPKKKEKDRITFYNYITWIQAMLQNEDTLKLSEEVAEALIKYQAGQKRLTKRKKEIEELWESYNRQQLIDNLSVILEKDSDVAETLNRAVNQLMTEIPQDMYKLFLSLIKFKYHYQQSN